MAWSNEEISQFQIDNSKALAEINATLMPDIGLNGKVGIFAPGQMGDLMSCMGVLKYRKEIFPGKEIIWFANSPNADCLRYAPISEVRPWPWAGNGLPEGTPDFYPLLCDENNRLNKELAKQYELTADLEDGFFPTPWMVAGNKREGLDYPSVSKKIFGVPDHYEWHPYLSFSDDECDMVDDFFKEQNPMWRFIMFETFAGSGQSSLDGDMVAKTIDLCNEHWGKTCVFVFVSHKFLKSNEQFPSWLTLKSDPHPAFKAKFTPRQCALFADRCDLMISVSSGITVAVSCWWNHPIPIIQYCGSKICGTFAIANGIIESVYTDDKNNQESKAEFYNKLQSMLTKI